jgi:DNA repair protein RAD59
MVLDQGFSFDSKYADNCTEITSTIEFFPDLLQFLQDDSDDKLLDGIQTEWALVKIGTLQSRLETLTTRKRKHNSYPTKISTHTIINLANDVFGYDGWSSQILEFEIKFEQSKYDHNHENEQIDQYGDDDHDMRFGFTAYGMAVVRVELTDGTFRDATGYATAVNLPRGMCLSNCRKQAITDASKNAILSFRELLLEYEIHVKLEPDLEIKMESLL